MVPNATKSKKRKRGEKKNVEPEEERIRGEPVRLWRIVTDYRDVFSNFILPKLSGNDVKFLYDVNTESREAIKRSGVRLKEAFKIRDFDTISLISWAFSKARGQRQIFCEAMARNGNLELLKSLRLQGCSWNVNTCYGAAENGHLECLKYAHENGCPWNGYTASMAAENGHLKCLKYAHKNGCPWSEWTCSSAAQAGHFECLKYAHENGCPWDQWTCCNAARGGHLECLKYARENGCPWDKWTPGNAARGKKKGHLECLKYALENGCPGSKIYAHRFSS